MLSGGRGPLGALGFYGGSVRWVGFYRGVAVVTTKMAVDDRHLGGKVITKMAVKTPTLVCGVFPKVVAFPRLFCMVVR